MKTPLLPFRGIVLALMLCALTATTAPGNDELSMYSGANGLRSEWELHVWGGLTAAELPGAGREADQSSIETTVSGGTQPYSGLTVKTGSGKDAQAASIPLSEELKGSGAVTLHLNGGKNLAGGEGTDIPLQYALVFVMQDGTTKSSKFLPMSAVSASEVVDGDSTTWQEVRMPIGKFLETLGEQADQIYGVSGVTMQYLGDAVSGFLVTDCEIAVE